MSVTVLVTNLTAAAVELTDLYTTLGASGATNASISFTRSTGQIDDMQALKALLHAGTVSVSVTQSSDNADLMSLPLEQHGVSAALAVDAIAVVTATVTFAKPFPSAPKVFCQIVQGVSPNEAWKGVCYIRSVTASSFLIALDVTAAEATGGSTATINWMAVL